jgi:hypothetical protein
MNLRRKDRIEELQDENKSLRRALAATNRLLDSALSTPAFNEADFDLHLANDGRMPRLAHRPRHVERN